MRDERITIALLEFHAKRFLENRRAKEWHHGQTDAADHDETHIEIAAQLLDAVAQLGGAFELQVLGATDPHSQQAAHAVAAAWLMGEGPERDSLLGNARALRRKIDPVALPILLPALSLGKPMGPLRRPLAYWWAAKRGTY